MPFVGRPYRRTSRHCADIVNVSSLTESGIRRFSIGLAQGTGLVTDALDSSKMTLMPSTTRNKANVHSRAKRSLAKVCGAAESGLSPLGAML
jgi:hypothetical protein